MRRSLGLKLGLLVAATAAILWIGWEGAYEPATSPRPLSSQPLSSQPLEPQSPIDLNRATAEELATLPGVGEVIAQRIIRRREDRGSYSSARQLLEVRGIGHARLARIRPLIHVSPAGAARAATERPSQPGRAGSRGS